MRIKKFEADTFQEALSQVKKDFGSEAVILHTKKYIKGGIFGLFGREITEVTAGIDINLERNRPQESSFEKTPQPTVQYTTNQYSSKKLHSPQVNIQQRFEAQAPVNNRIEDISQKNENLARELSQGKVSAAGSYRPARDLGTINPAAVALKSGIGRVQKLLIENGVEESLVYRTLQTINAQLTDVQINNKVFMEQFLYDYLADMDQVSGSIKTTPGTAKVIAFIGPTGVGKTTTIA